MSNGVFAVLLLLGFIGAVKAGRPLWMAVFAVGFASVLVAGGGPIAGTAGDLTEGARSVINSIGAAFDGG